MSGGRNTVARRRGSGHAAHAGDIVCTHRSGQPLLDLFVVECKFYRDLKLHGLFFGNHPDILEWWDKVLDECDGKREPLLIAKQNRIGELLVTTHRGLRWLQWGGRPKHRVIVMHKRSDMYVLGLTDLFLLRWAGIKRAAAWHQRRHRRPLSRGRLLIRRRVRLKTSSDRL